MLRRRLHRADPHPGGQGREYRLRPAQQLHNYINKEYLLEHYRTVRSDHTARAVENRVYFVRGNNYVPKDPKKTDGVGYGDSYVVDPFGEIVVRSRQFEEDFLIAEVNLALARDNNYKRGRALWSFREFGKLLADAAGG
jgi:predicted amidohydrolase